MAQITVSNLTFAYPGAYDDIFKNVSFSIDTKWKLGFIGRNGRGKTTMMRLFMGQYEYSGSIISPVEFSYFPMDDSEAKNFSSAKQYLKSVIGPYVQLEGDMERALESGDNDLYSELLMKYLELDGYEIDARLETECAKLNVDPDALERPYNTLSNGERTKTLLAALFLRPNNFLLIDEPTNHLDTAGRAVVRDYLSGKEGYILISHDRALLDAVCDHVLSINRSTIDVQAGNYSTWAENKRMRDEYDIERNEHLKGEIKRLTETAREKAAWSDKIEASKIGNHVADRGAVGARAAKMMQKSKNAQRRVEKNIEEKESLMKDLELVGALKLPATEYVKPRLMDLFDVSINYGQGALFSPRSFSVMRGDRIALTGPNGCGKSSLLKLILGENIPHTGKISMSGGIKISYLPQESDKLQGPVREFAQREGVDETLFLTLLRKLEFPRVQFEKDLSQLSLGQRRKALLAITLATAADLYIWDEPLNYIDVISRTQIEEALLYSKPTMIFVEHDDVFVNNVATKIIKLQ